MTALALALAAVCCAGGPLSPDAGYERVREDAEPLESARITCRERATFRDRTGLAWVDWQAFEACMDEHGWARP